MLDWQNTSTWSVLVVDDEPDNLEVVAEALGFFGASTKTAKDGLDALAVLQTFTPNLILLDLSMPKMTGWETRARIKADPRIALVPVIALTAHAMTGDLERALAAGFDGYLTKPINLPTLINDIRAAVPNKQTASSVAPPNQLPASNGAATEQQAISSIAPPNQPPAGNPATPEQQAIHNVLPPNQPSVNGAAASEQPPVNNRAVPSQHAVNGLASPVQSSAGTAPHEQNPNHHEKANKEPSVP